MYHKDNTIILAQVDFSSQFTTPFPCLFQRRKLPQMQFTPSTLQKLQVNGVFGEKVGLDHDHTQNSRLGNI